MIFRRLLMDIWRGHCDSSGPPAKPPSEKQDGGAFSGFVLKFDQIWVFILTVRLSSWAHRSQDLILDMFFYVPVVSSESAWCKRSKKSSDCICKISKMFVMDVSASIHVLRNYMNIFWKCCHRGWILKKLIRWKQWHKVYSSNIALKLQSLQKPPNEFCPDNKVIFLSLHTNMADKSIQLHMNATRPSERMSCDPSELLPLYFQRAIINIIDKEEQTVTQPAPLRMVGGDRGQMKTIQRVIAFLSMQYNRTLPANACQ